MGQRSVRWRRVGGAVIEATLSLPSKLYAIASEIAPTDFRMLPSTRFGPSNRVRMPSMKVILRREQSNRGGLGEQGAMAYRK
jgi:hypothetical protein